MYKKVLVYYVVIVFYDRFVILLKCYRGECCFVKINENNKVL